MLRVQSGETPLHLTVRDNRTSAAAIASTLLGRGADIHAKDKACCRMLGAAALPDSCALR